MALSSSRPYLIRALYDWIVDGGEDPYVVVDCFYPGVEVPESHIKDGQIVLNLAPRALNDWEMSDFGLTFQTRSQQSYYLMERLQRFTVKNLGLNGVWSGTSGVPELQSADAPPYLEPVIRRRR